MEMKEGLIFLSSQQFCFDRQSKVVWIWEASAVSSSWCSHHSMKKRKKKRMGKKRRRSFANNPENCYAHPHLYIFRQRAGHFGTDFFLSFLSFCFAERAVQQGHHSGRLFWLLCCWSGQMAAKLNQNIVTSCPLVRYNGGGKSKRAPLKTFQLISFPFPFFFLLRFPQQQRERRNWAEKHFH